MYLKYTNKFCIENAFAAQLINKVIGQRGVKIGIIEWILVKNTSRLLNAPL